MRKVIVAMSGGVDSSVAAALLFRQGFEVVGVTMRLLPRGGEGFGCCGNPDDMAIAKRSAEKIGIPHYVLDYSADFEEKVINYFVNSYLIGETPNPCLACNRFIKFDKLKTFAKSVGASHIATGHYARIVEETRLFEAVDPSKDQSYVLFNFNQEGLRSSLFPVGDKPKAEIRALARDFGLPNADKKDSQEICFVPKRDYKSFVKNQIQERGTKAATLQPGPMKDGEGRLVGEHQGVAFYTVGQRRGLGHNLGRRAYVTRLDPATNTLVIGKDEDGLSRRLSAGDVNWIAGEPPAPEFEALVKIRYKHEPAPARVCAMGSGFEVQFQTPQRAVSPGQAAVVYRRDSRVGAREVLGGGKILAR